MNINTKTLMFVELLKQSLFVEIWLYQKGEKLQVNDFGFYLIKLRWKGNKEVQPKYEFFSVPNIDNYKSLT